MTKNRWTTLILTTLAIVLPASAAQAAIDFGPAEQFRFKGPSGTAELEATLAAEDFDEDGELDLLAAGGDQSALLRGDGKGGFDPDKREPLRSPSFGEFRDIDAADVNGDGDLDIVAALGDFEQRITVFLGRGDGTFAVGPSTELVEQPEALAVGDVDGDGDDDVVSAGFGNLQVLRNDGTGNLSLSSTIEGPGNCCETVEIGRLDADGDLDFIATDPYGDLHVFLGDGAGVFAPQPSIKVLGSNGPYLTSAQIADLNGDGASDLVLYNDDDRKPTLHALLGNNAGGFTAQPSVPVNYHASGGTGPEALELADVDGDGALDAIAGGQDLDNGPISVFTGDGTGGFGDQTSFAAHMGPSAVAAADFDGDGLTDLAGANHYEAISVTTLLGRDDRVTCRGEAADFVGQTPGDTRAAKGKAREDDTAYGSAGDDVISTGAGPDYPFGFDGDDVICGGADGDLIRSHKGDDVIVGGPGPDEINAGSGRDVCIGGGGADKLRNCESER